jgi:Cu+-exporting ATPase
LLNGALDRLESSQNAREVYQDYRQARRDAIARRMALTDLRLFWEAVGAALNGREKIIIDAEQVPGRRQLLMFDPEMLRGPALDRMLRPMQGQDGP